MNECRMVVLGNPGVGKSALVMQFTQTVFVENYDPTLGDSFRTTYRCETQDIMLEIVDTAGVCLMIFNS